MRTYVLVMKVEEWGRGSEQGCEREGGDGIYLPGKENEKLFEKQGNQHKAEDGEIRKAVENRKKYNDMPVWKCNNEPHHFE